MLHVFAMQTDIKSVCANVSSLYIHIQTTQVVNDCCNYFLIITLKNMLFAMQTDIKSVCANVSSLYIHIQTTQVVNDNCHYFLIITLKYSEILQMNTP